MTTAATSLDPVGYRDFALWPVESTLLIKGLVKSVDLLKPSEPDAGSSAPDGSI